MALLGGRLPTVTVLQRRTLDRRSNHRNARRRVSRPGSRPVPWIGQQRRRHRFRRRLRLRGQSGIRRGCGLLGLLERPRRRGALRIGCDALLWIGRLRRRLKDRVRRRGDNGCRRRCAGLRKPGPALRTSPYHNRYRNYNWCMGCNWCTSCNCCMGCKQRRQPPARPCRPACTWCRAPSYLDMPKDTRVDRQPRRNRSTCCSRSRAGTRSPPPAGRAHGKPPSACICTSAVRNSRTRSSAQLPHAGAQLPQAGATQPPHAGATTTGAAGGCSQPKMQASLNAGIDTTASTTPHTIVRIRIFGFNKGSPPLRRKEYLLFIKSRKGCKVKWSQAATPQMVNLSDCGDYTVRARSSVGTDSAGAQAPAESACTLV